MTAIHIVGAEPDRSVTQPTRREPIRRAAIHGSVSAIESGQIGWEAIGRRR